MYQLPGDFDPAVFVGQALTSIVFTENTVTFIFGSNDWIHVYHGVDIRKNGDYKRFMYMGNDEPKIEARLGAVLGQVVAAIEVFDAKTIRIRFDNGFEVDFLGDVENYECYELLVAGRTILV